MCATNSWLRWALLVGVVALALGCSREPPLAQPPPVEVVVAQPIQKEIDNWDTYTGTLEARESVEIRSRVRGEIKEVLFTEGKEIEAKTLLFRIDDGPFKADLLKAEGELTTWKAELKAAEEKIAIYEPLAKKQTVAKEELVEALKAKGKAVGSIGTAEGKILEAKLNIGYCEISAPIKGKVGEALLTKGNMVSGSGSDSLLTTLVSMDPMYVYFYVNETAYKKYRKILEERSKNDPKAPKGDKLRIPVKMTISGTDYDGVVDFVDNRIDPATGSIKVRARFDNPVSKVDERRPLTVGLFVRVRIDLVNRYEAILVADRAILTDQDLKYVLVVDRAKNNEVKRVPIVASDRLQNDGLRAVTKGLTKDMWVIVEGVNRQRPGVTVNPKEGPMIVRQAGAE